MSDYVLGTDILIGAVVFPSVSVYPISAAQDMLDEVNAIVGELLGAEDDWEEPDPKMLAGRELARSGPTYRETGKFDKQKTYAVGDAVEYEKNYYGAVRPIAGLSWFSAIFSSGEVPGKSNAWKFIGKHLKYHAPKLANKYGLISIGGSAGPMLWPRGNFDFDVEGAVARLASRRDVDDFEDIIGEVIGAPAVYKGPAYFEGSDEDLLAQLDLDRRWDESFDEAILRRSGGSMRGGSR